MIINIPKNATHLCIEVSFARDCFASFSQAASGFCSKRSFSKFPYKVLMFNAFTEANASVKK